MISSIAALVLSLGVSAVVLCFLSIRPTLQLSSLRLVVYPFCTLVALKCSIWYIVWIDPSMLVFLTSAGLVVHKYWRSKSGAHITVLRLLETGLAIMLASQTDLKTLMTPSILLTHTALAVIAIAQLNDISNCSIKMDAYRPFREDLATFSSITVTQSLALIFALLPSYALTKTPVPLPIALVPVFPDIRFWQHSGTFAQCLLITTIGLATTWACIRGSAWIGWTINIGLLSLYALAQDQLKQSGPTQPAKEAIYLAAAALVAFAIPFASAREMRSETTLKFETPMHVSASFEGAEEEEERDYGSGEDPKSVEMESFLMNEKSAWPRRNSEQFKSSPRDGWLALAAYSLALLATLLCRTKAPLDWKSIDTRGNTKFIVVTSIALPTDVMDHYCALTDWEVVVVADTKTPVTWHDGACHFLSVEDQYRLPFNTPRHIPYRAYTRKNLGYLYAIALGAETLFDTDDDNDMNAAIKVIDPDDPHYETVFNPEMTKDTVINPYKHFGRSDIWPRGYPLEQIDAKKNYSMASTLIMPPELEGRALVLQGLADLDPDVDAIFRLTNPEDIATVHFDKKASPIKLARGIASPFNSQNTLWHKDAFWGMLLPITVTFRATDIMRGYWCQRMLWDIGAVLAFGPPTVDQVRNAHDYLSDMESELDLYIHVGKFVTFLQTWTSTATALDDRIIDLGRAMVKQGFFNQPDLDLMEAWLSDLRQLNYKFPDVQPFNLEAAAVAAKTKAPDYHAIAQQWQDTASDPNWPRFEKTLLIVQFNYAKYSALPFFVELYSRFFPHMTFYGNEPYKNEELNIEINVVDNWAANLGGGKSYVAAVAAYKANPGYGSYLFINDDIALNPFAVGRLDNSKIWHPVWHSDKWIGHADYGSNPKAFGEALSWWNWWADPSCTTSMVAAIDEINARQPARMKQQVWSNQGDVWSVPAQDAAEVFGMLETFANHTVWLEVAVATAFANMDPSRIDDSIPAGASMWTWEGDRLNYPKHLTTKMEFYHPLKMSGKRLDAEPNIPLGVAQNWLLQAREEALKRQSGQRA